MPIAMRRATKLGCQWIPPFSKWVTLHQNPQCWDGYPESTGFPEANSIYNIACLVLWPRIRLASVSSPQALGGLSRSYWSTQIGQGVRCIFGETKIQIPQGCELVSVSWMKPPDWTIAAEAQGPYPEDLFRLQYGLAV